MQGLNQDALDVLKEHYLTPEEYARAYYGYDVGDTWPGSPCGCPDDRCIGHHHAADEECGCVWSLARDVHDGVFK